MDELRLFPENSSVSRQSSAGTTHARSGDVETLIWHDTPAGRTATVRETDLKQAPLVLAIFMVTQLLDGVLTYWGVSRFGIGLEMNSLLVATIEEIGLIAALLAAKGLACVCGVVLYINFYFRPLAAVAGLCLGLAVVPWMIIVAWVV